MNRDHEHGRNNVHHHHHFDESFVRALTGALTGNPESLTQRFDHMEQLIMSAVDNLKAANARMLAAVEKNTSVDQSILGVVNSQVETMRMLQQQLQDAINSNNDAAIQEVADALGSQASQLEQDNQKIVDAVTANTPPTPSTNG